MSCLPDKVLHIAPTPYFADRGCHIRIRGIVRGLANLGIDSTVCTYPIGRDNSDVTTIRCWGPRKYTKTDAGPSSYKYIVDLSLIWTTIGTIRKCKPEILHCHLHEGVLVGWVAKHLAFRRRLPIVFDMQGGLVGELDGHGYFDRRPGLRRVFRWIERRIVRMADSIACSSSASADLLRELGGVDPQVIIVARDGADTERAVNLSPESPVNEDDVPQVVYAGGLTETKGLRVLQAVIRECHDRKLGLQFMIIGYPTAELTEFVERHDLENVTNIVGQVDFDELGQYLTSAAVAIEPKEAGSGEASGKLVNYMSAGVPIVCYDTPNNREILDGAGFFAEQGSVGSFVNQIEFATQDREAAEEFVIKNKIRVREHFSWDRTARNIVAAYDLAN